MQAVWPSTPLSVAQHSVVVSDENGGWDPMRVVWERVDTDGSGSLGREELREVMSQMGRIVTDAKLTATMEQVDMDGSGEVDFDEFGAFT